MATAKKAVKKVAKKVAKKVSEPEASKFNEFGVCIDCQGGIPDCLHNNLAVMNGKTYCNVCGIQICL